MSKSVSDQNVEDMLSSVRRLVSNELPRNQRSRLPEGPGALVLTEAQRVAPRIAHSEPRGMSLEDRIAELEAAVDGQTDDWEPDGSEDQTLNRPDRIVFRPSRPLTEEEQRRPLRLSEIALIETGPANEPDEAEPDASAEASEVSFRHEDAPSEEPEDAVEVTPTVLEETPATEPEPEDRFAGDPFADAIARDVAAVVAEMAETALTRQGDFESDLTEAVGSVEELPAEEDDELTHEESVYDADEAVAEIAEIEAAEVAPVEQVAANGKDDEDDDNDAVADAAPAGTRPTSMTREDRARLLNEGIELGPELTEALRPLISAMIREELQGELGERITRNVRKLVRQEVNRALSVRDLE